MATTTSCVHVGGGAQAAPTAIPRQQRLDTEFRTGSFDECAWLAISSPDRGRCCTATALTDLSDQVTRAFELPLLTPSTHPELMTNCCSQDV
jgi:hypothetical protein